MDTTTSRLDKPERGPQKNGVGKAGSSESVCTTQNVLPMYDPRKEEVARTPLFIGSLALGFRAQRNHNKAWRVKNVPAFDVYIPLRFEKLARKKMLDIQAFSCALGVMGRRAGVPKWMPMAWPNNNGIWRNV